MKEIRRVRPAKSQEVQRRGTRLPGWSWNHGDGKPNIIFLLKEGGALFRLSLPSLGANLGSERACGFQFVFRNEWTSADSVQKFGLLRLKFHKHRENVEHVQEFGCVLREPMVRLNVAKRGWLSPVP